MQGYFFLNVHLMKGLWQDSGKDPPDFGTWESLLHSSLPSSTQPSHSGMQSYKVLDTAGKYIASYLQYLWKILVILVAMLLTLKGKIWVRFSSYAKVLLLSDHTLLQLPLLHRLPHSHTTSLWTAQNPLFSSPYWPIDIPPPPHGCPLQW